jgi:hypothetical protein
MIMIDGAISNTTNFSLVGNAYNYVLASGLDRSIPSIASAASVALPFTETFILTGASDVSTFTNGWLGRKISFINYSSLTLSSAGGNIARSVTLPANAYTTMIFNGSQWYITT